MTEPEDKNTDEIDLIEIARKLWKGRKTILISAALFFFLGIFLALISPKKYVSQATLLIETEAGSAAGMTTLLQQIAEASGVKVTQRQAIESALSPDLYPVITTSTPFLLELAEQQVNDPETGKPVTVAGYLDQHPPQSLQGILLGYTIGLPGKIITLFRSDDDQNEQAEGEDQQAKPKKYSPGGETNRQDPAASHSREDTGLMVKTTTGPGAEISAINTRIQQPLAQDLSQPLTKAQLITTGRLKACITTEATVSKGKNRMASPNMLTVSVEVHDAEVATQLTRLVVENLTRYITEYRTRKVKNDLQFINSQLADAEVKYRRAQQALASTTDRNQSILLATARTDANRRQSEYTLAFNVFNSLVQMKEQAKIKVQENTPVFTMIEPPSKAEKISQGLKIEMIMLFLGILAGVGIVFGKPALVKFREQMKEK